MRAFLISFLVLVVGCEPDHQNAPPPCCAEHDDATSEALARAASDVSDLRRIVAEQRAEIDALKARARVPHLVSRETGADFGPFVSWEQYWHDGIGEYVQLGTPGIMYTKPDCVGDEYVAINPRGVTYTRGPDGTLLHVIGPATTEAMKSIRQLGRCSNDPPSISGRRFEDTGIEVADFNARDLAVTLR